MVRFFFFFNDTATTEIYTLSLHDALPICRPGEEADMERTIFAMELCFRFDANLHATLREHVKSETELHREDGADRKSTRLNSSHLVISYAVFCLKKKKKQQIHAT